MFSELNQKTSPNPHSSVVCSLIFTQSLAAARRVLAFERLFQRHRAVMLLQEVAKGLVRELLEILHAVARQALRARERSRDRTQSVCADQRRMLGLTFFMTRPATCRRRVISRSHGLRSGLSVDVFFGGF